MPPVGSLLSLGTTPWPPVRFYISIGRAGPYPTAWAGVYSVQESMAQEPLGGWHRIHLFSTTLHRIGIGVYVDSSGWIWFSEDMVS